MYKWIRKWLKYRDDYLTLYEESMGLEAKNVELGVEVYNLDQKYYELLDSVSNKFTALELRVELAVSQVKGITADRDELQLEHEQVMERCDRLVARNTEYASEIDKNRVDLKNCNDRMVRYRDRSIDLTNRITNFKMHAKELL